MIESPSSRYRVSPAVSLFDTRSPFASYAYVVVVVGPGGGAGQVTFTKIPKFQTLISTNGEWRLGMLGTADTTLVIGLNYDDARAELTRRMRAEAKRFGMDTLPHEAL